jgi:hypothetical protein
MKGSSTHSQPQRSSHPLLYPCANNPGSHCAAGRVGATAGLTSIHTTAIRTPDRQARSLVSIQSAPLQTTEDCSRCWSALTGKYHISNQIHPRPIPSESFPIQHQTNYYWRYAVPDTDTLKRTAQHTRPYWDMTQRALLFLPGVRRGGQCCTADL